MILVKLAIRHYDDVLRWLETTTLGVLIIVRIDRQHLFTRWYKRHHFCERSK